MKITLNLKTDLYPTVKSQKNACIRNRKLKGLKIIKHGIPVRQWAWSVNIWRKSVKKGYLQYYVLLWSDFLEEKTLATQQVVQNCVRTPIPKFYSYVVF